MNLRKKFSGQFILVSLFIGFIGYTIITNFISQIDQIHYYKEEIQSLKQKIDTTKQEITKVEESKIEAKKDFEAIARNTLNMVKPGEIIYIDTGKEGE